MYTKPTRKGTIWCELCQLSLSTANWARHQRRIHGEIYQPRGKRKLCEICFKEYDRGQFRRHIRSCHSDKDDIHIQADVQREQEGLHEEAELQEQAEQELLSPQEILHDTSNATQRCLDQLAHHLKEGRRSGYKTRFEYDAALYRQDIDRARQVLPYTSEEYLAIKDDSQKLKRAYVVCTTAEARLILQDHTPKAPLLVQPEQHGQSGLIKLKSYLAYLSTKLFIDVHQLFDPVDEDHYSHNIPVSMTGREAVAKFLDRDYGPINFLNLAIWKQNEIPACIAGLNDYAVLRDTSATGLSGKESTSRKSDLTSCTSFHICAKAGALSLAHLDHHGVLTTVTCEEGEKLWLTWPDLQEDDLRSWMESKTASPSEQPYPILIRPGYVLIQPPGRVHAPYSMTDVLMTGTMHWDTRNLVSVLCRSIFEKQYPDVTNEPQSKEFPAKMKRVLQMWDDDAAAYQWASQEELARCLDLLKRYKSRKPATRKDACR